MCLYICIVWTEKGWFYTNKWYHSVPATNSSNWIVCFRIYQLLIWVCIHNTLNVSQRGCNCHSEQDNFPLFRAATFFARCYTFLASPSPNAGSTQFPIWQSKMLSHLFKLTLLIIFLHNLILWPLNFIISLLLDIYDSSNFHSHKHIHNKHLCSSFFLLMGEGSTGQSREVESLVSYTRCVDFPSNGYLSQPYNAIHPPQIP